MRKLPIQSAPVQRSRSARAANEGGVQASAFLWAWPFQQDGGVSASITIIPPLFPFADAKAD